MARINFKEDNINRLSTLAIAAGLLSGAAMLPATADAALFNFAGPKPTFTCPTEVPTCNAAAQGDINSQDLNGTNELNFSVGGVGMEAVATSSSGTVGTYYDIEGFAAGRGGLGVRTAGFGGTGEQIDIGTGDTLTLNLSSSLALTAVTVFTEAHGLYTGTIHINGTSFSVTNSVVNLAGLGTSASYAFTTGGVDAKDYYLSAVNVVPLPGAALFFGTALAGLGWVRRRRNGASSEAAAA